MYNSSRFLNGRVTGRKARKEVRKAAYELKRTTARIMTKKKAILVEYLVGSMGTPKVL